MIKLEFIGCNDFITTIIGLSLGLIISLIENFTWFHENWKRILKNSFDILNGKICYVGPPTGACLRTLELDN